MRHIPNLTIFAWTVSLFGFFLLVFTGNASRFPQELGPSVPVDVGMVALTAVPERYEGRFVRTHGFLCVEFEGTALYLHEEDYLHGLTKNSLALRLSKSQLERFKALSLKYVLVEGTVYAAGPERQEWGGAIGNIARLEVWPIDRRVGHP